ncbi:MAG: hypothetical protein HRF49_10150 [bacterium]|jgi:hypothetical protein
MKTRRILIVAAAVLAAVLVCTTSNAQFGDLLGGLPKLPGLDIGMNDDPPITTSFDDAVTSVPYLDDYKPARVFPVCEMPEGPGGKYLVQPGVYRMQIWSYCLHAGTHGPGRGEGYLLAPLKGKRAKIIQAILDRSVDHPEIEQHDIQILIWAILARTKLTEMNHEMQAVAAKLLTEKELLELQGGVLGLVPPELWNKAFGNLPPGVREIYEAEARLRQTLTSGYSSYSELEAIAVLAGDPQGDKGPEIPRGRWSVHPDGYFIRFFPHGYSDMHMEMMCPQKCDVARDSKGRIYDVLNENGDRIEIEYDDSIAPLAFKGTKDAAGHAIKSVRLFRSHVRPAAEWTKPGWTIVGNPGKSAPGSGAAYPDAAAYAKFASQFGGELDSLLKTAPKGSSISKEIRADMYDLAMLGYAVRKITGYIAPDISVHEEFPPAAEGFDEIAFRSNMPVPAELKNANPGGDPADVSVRLLCDALSDRILRVLTPTTYVGMQASLSYEKPALHEIESVAASNSANGANRTPWPAFENALGVNSSKPHYLSGGFSIAGFPNFEAARSALRQGVVAATGRSEFGGGGVAAPANRGRQRLALSPREKPNSGGRRRGLPEYDPNRPRRPDQQPEEPRDSPGKDGFDKLRKVLDWFGYGNNAADLATSGVKGFAANQIGMGIPNYGMGKIVDFNVNTWEKASNALAGDPPDPDYKRIAKPEEFDFPKLTAADGCSQERADAINAYLQASLAAVAHARAASQSLDRHGGAVLAKDADWIYKQRDAILHYKHLAGVHYLDAADKLDALIAVLRSEGVAALTVTPDAMRKYQNRLRSEGWTQFEKDAMKKLGYSDAEMAELLELRVSVSPEEASGELLARSEWLAWALREVGAYLADLPYAELPAE